MHVLIANLCSWNESLFWIVEGSCIASNLHHSRRFYLVAVRMSSIGGMLHVIIVSSFNYLYAEDIVSIFSWSTNSWHFSSIDFISAVCWTVGMSVIGILSYLIASFNNYADVLIHASIMLLEFGKKISCSSIKLTKKSFEYCCNDSPSSCGQISLLLETSLLNMVAQ